MPIEADLPADPDRWVFDEQVAEHFDDMLARSIPQYEVMRDVIAGLAADHLAALDTPALLDLGSSRGEMIARVLSRLDRHNLFPVRVLGAEVSAPMRDAARARFAHDERVSDVADIDLRSGLHAYLTDNESRSSTGRACCARSSRGCGPAGCSSSSRKCS